MTQLSTFAQFKEWILIILSGAILALVGNTWYNVNDLVTKDAVRQAKEAENEKWKSSIEIEISGLKKDQQENNKQIDRLWYYVKPDEIRAPKRTVEN